MILFASSCHWSDKCFFDLNTDWFELRHYSSPLPNPLPRTIGSGEGNSVLSGKQDASFLLNAMNETASALTGVAMDEIGRRLQMKPEWTGIGFGWLRSLLGVREWRIPCLDVLVRL